MKDEAAAGATLGSEADVFMYLPGGVCDGRFYVPERKVLWKVSHVRQKVRGREEMRYARHNERGNEEIQSFSERDGRGVS